MRKGLRLLAVALTLSIAACDDDDDPAPAGTPPPGGGAPTTQAATLLGLTDDARIVQFRASSPGTLIGTITITGYQDAGSQNPPFPVVMDVRPSNNEIFVLFSDDRLYKIAPSNGAATLVGVVPIGNADVRAMDFNP